MLKREKLKEKVEQTLGTRVGLARQVSPQIAHGPYFWLWLKMGGLPSDRHGKYAYSVVDYGLDADELKEQFADYYDHFLR